ncbi:MAG: hypothetical protein FGM58_09250 [Acidimicrobiia bacterium]|nr:hypothetical protein [Acidimicrobiia bacterium]
MNNRTDDTRDLLGASVLERLQAAGFEVVDRSGDDGHVLVRRGAHEFAVPGPDRTVPGAVARMIEAALEPLLGPGWLLSVVDVDRDAPVDIDGAAGVHMLDTAVLSPDGDAPWRAFLLDDLATVGFGDDRTTALRDLKAAAALRLHCRPEDIVLITPEVL